MYMLTDQFQPMDLTVNGPEESKVVNIYLKRGAPTN